MAKWSLSGRTPWVRISLHHLAQTLDGSVDPSVSDVAVTGADIDSRTIGPGALFVPLVAERDGHDFVAAALERGAAGFLSDRPMDGPSVEVADTGAALTQLGRWARAQLGGPVVGVTGSVGKTSIKDLIAAAVGSQRRTHANLRSFNNELGLPLTLFNAPADTEVTVVEMGARGIGHIAELCAIARPTVAVVTRIALAHSELFGSLDGVAQAKGELVEALGSDGTAVLNGDDPEVARLRARTVAPVVTWGTGADADIRITGVTLDELMQPTATLATPQGTIEVRVPRSGAHMAHNAAGALAVCHALGLDLAVAADGIATAELSPWRMEATTTAAGSVIINDAYNANPTSVRAALEVLVGVGRPRKVAVLGAMAELGVEGDDEHDAVASEATALGIEVIAVGAPAYGANARHVESINEAAAAVGQLGPNDAVLIKGSRVAELERLASRWLT